MLSKLLICGVLVVAVAMSMSTCFAANGIGDVTGTSSPEVVMPPLIGPAQTPSYLAPPILVPAPAYLPLPKGMAVPRSLAPVRPRW
jgi:hypothetical protein